MYKKILFPVDVTEEGSCLTALPAVQHMMEQNDAELFVITVLPDVGMSLVTQYFPQDAIHKITEEAEQTLENFVQKHFPRDMKCQKLISHGSIYRSIVDAAERIGADLIIMGAHKPELKDFLLGPNAAKVVEHSKCSVLVARGK